MSRLSGASPPEVARPDDAADAAIAADSEATAEAVAAHPPDATAEGLAAESDATADAALAADPEAPATVASDADGWQEVVDEASGHTYYHQPSTGKSQWTPPDETGSGADDSARYSYSDV